jgi:hypothetical protein
MVVVGIKIIFAIMAMPSGAGRIAPFWEELSIVCLNEDYLLDIPEEIDSADKYRHFLCKTETEVDFDAFFDRFLVEMRQMKKVPVKKLCLMLETIGEHLMVFHHGENFQAGVSVMTGFLLYMEYIFRQKIQQKVKELLESMSVSSK